MGSHFDHVTNLAPDEPPPKTSFFSRITSPLRSRTRNLADFHVRLKEPHRQYSAGDHVKGTIVLYVVKPIRITHLTVALHGYVRVYKSAAAGAQLGPVNPALISHDGNRNFKYHGNGHASLFQDEQVLCGEGRLKPTRFEFEFDLVFPSTDLPSSIDFERGTISYMVTATLTRPTSIAPTTSCETKVSLVERIDIGVVTPPRERKVTMQTMHRRTKRRKPATTVVPSAKRDTQPNEIPEPVSDRDSLRVHEDPNDSSVNLGEPVQTAAGLVNMPRSPLQVDLQSEVSGDSAVSNNSGSNSGTGVDVSSDSVAGNQPSGSPGREITATVELSKGGCLPGDALPVKIKIEHNRYVKSMHGIIVTLYRQGRVDYAPPLSQFENLSVEDARRLEREEYYPRSRTGLGGLSLSSAGSCSVFRKDLSQAVAPLIVDPDSLTATITTAVRVPEDVFPSIKNVPGGLLSFKYHLEVVVDLGGRLTGPSTGGSHQPARMGSVSIAGNNAASAAQFGIDIKRLANWNGNIVDTDHLRRVKGVIAVSFEVVIGTADSTRSRGKSVVRPILTVQPPSQDISVHDDELNYFWRNTFDDDNDHNGDFGTGQPQQSPHDYFQPVSAPQTSYYDFQDPPPQVPIYVPSPEIPRDTGLTEKERIRQAEQRLLPSQPAQSSAESAAAPSQAPALSEVPEASNLVISQTADISSAPGPSAPSAPRLTPEDADDGPSAPSLDDLAHAGSTSSPSDDKQELERRRLLVEASAPPDMPEDYDISGPSAPVLDGTGPSRSEEASAPVLHEDDDYEQRDPYHSIPGPPALAHTTEPLPRYER